MARLRRFFNRAVPTERDQHPAWHPHFGAGPAAPRADPHPTREGRDAVSGRDLSRQTRRRPQSIARSGRRGDGLEKKCLGPSADYANPSSVGHCRTRPELEFEQARADVADWSVADPSQSSSRPVPPKRQPRDPRAARFYRSVAGSGTSRTEQPGGARCLPELDGEGFEVTYLKPGPTASSSRRSRSCPPQRHAARLADAREPTRSGVAQDVGAWGACARARRAVPRRRRAGVGRAGRSTSTGLHRPLALTAHKVARTQRRGALSVRREPAWTGANAARWREERGLRSGTLATHQVVGLGTAPAHRRGQMQADAARIGALRERLWAWAGGLPCASEWSSVARCPHPERHVRWREGESLLYALPASGQFQAGRAHDERRAVPT